MAAAQDNLRGGGRRVVFGASGFSVDEEEEEDSSAVSSDCHIHKQISHLKKLFSAVRLTCLHVGFLGFTECFGSAWAGGSLLL